MKNYPTFLSILVDLHITSKELYSFLQNVPYLVLGAKRLLVVKN